MKYLVLGSSGQIGFPLTTFLRKNGHEALEFDIAEDSLKDLRIHKNIFLEKYIKESDFVFFLAFDVGGSRYLSKYQHTYDFLHNNILLMSNTFNLLKKYNKPFIFASSQMSNMSYSPYGVAKAVGERYTASLNGITVKFWNVYGPERDHEKSHVITDFVLKAKNTGIIDMMTDGSEQRQFLHALDCSKALYQLSLKYEDLPRDKNYHITSFKWNSIYEIAELIKEFYPNIIIKKAAAKDTVQLDKRNEPDEYILNYWNPTISLKDGIKLIIHEVSKI
jgi:nucleoside-diphosphate-sugar epimerase